MVFERWPTLAIMKRPTKTSCKASLLASPQRGWCAGEGIVRLRRPALEEAFCPSVPLLGDQRRCFARLAPLRCPCCCLCNGEAGGWSNPPPPQHTHCGKTSRGILQWDQPSNTSLLVSPMVGGILPPANFFLLKNAPLAKKGAHCCFRRFAQRIISDSPKAFQLQFGQSFFYL